MKYKGKDYVEIPSGDAIASRKKSDKKIALQRAVQEGILLTTAEAILFELTLDSRNPVFRQISQLVK